MLTTKEWEFAVISQDEAQMANVHWLPGRRLAEELIPTALSLGYTASELATYSIGELKDDLVINGAVFLRGAIVLPDEQGYPAALFGNPLIKSPSEPFVRLGGSLVERNAGVGAGGRGDDRGGVAGERRS